MTFEEKQQLSAGIAKLTSQNLSHVVKIIKASMPSLAASGDDIELDLNQLDTDTLWKLHSFVASAKKARPKKGKTTAAEQSQMLAQAHLNAQQELSTVNAGLSSLDGGGGGIDLQRHLAAGTFVESDSPSDSDLSLIHI